MQHTRLRLRSPRAGEQGDAVLSRTVLVWFCQECGDGLADVRVDERQVLRRALGRYVQLELHDIRGNELEYTGVLLGT